MPSFFMQFIINFIKSVTEKHKIIATSLLTHIYVYFVCKNLTNTIYCIIFDFAIDRQLNIWYHMSKRFKWL